VLQTEVTGEPEHEQLEEVEVIFGTYRRIDDSALRKCRNLHRLISADLATGGPVDCQLTILMLWLAVVVNCNLVEISGLEAAGESLVHLCLSNQNITTMSGLSALHQLRHLYLQQNRISRIEGLER
jgi:hypothetical protein